MSADVATAAISLTGIGIMRHVDYVIWSSLDLASQSLQDRTLCKHPVDVFILHFDLDIPLDACCEVILFNARRLRCSENENEWT